MSPKSELPSEFQAYADEDLDQLAAGSVGKNGVLEVVFTRGGDDVTRVSRSFAQPPFHLMRGLHHDEQIDGLVTLYIQNPSGGIAQGDRQQMEITAEPGAEAHITTSGATKVHQMEKNYAQTHLDITVDEDAYLEYIPGPTILYGDSRYHQSVNIEVERNAKALYSDIVVPGRIARGERFNFDRYYSRIQAHCQGDPIFTDTFSLCPAEEDVQRGGLLGEYPVFGNLYVITPAVEGSTLSDRIHERIAGQDGPVAGTSVLPSQEGVSVRAVGETSKDVTEIIHKAWDETRKFFFDSNRPKIRKY